jgi:hypothetical protein
MADESLTEAMFVVAIVFCRKEAVCLVVAALNDVAWDLWKVEAGAARHGGVIFWFRR